MRIILTNWTYKEKYGKSNWIRIFTPAVEIFSGLIALILLPTPYMGNIMICWYRFLMKKQYKHYKKYHP